MKATRKKLIMQLIVTLVAITSIVITTVFLGGCFDYMKASHKIASVEKDAHQNSYWTKNGWFNGWSEELQKKYNDAVEEKMELVESSDVAQWCYESANTLTGTVVRALAILLGIIVWIGSAMMVGYVICIDVSYINKKYHRS